MLYILKDGLDTSHGRFLSLGGHASRGHWGVKTVLSGEGQSWWEGIVGKYWKMADGMAAEASSTAH